MKYYKLSAKLLSPIMIQENRQSNTPKSLSHITGSTLRGALAMKYLRLGGRSEDDTFNTLFSSDVIKYPNLYPSDEQETTVASILPFTTVSCKNNSGFQQTIDDDNQTGHGVNDCLVEKLAKRQKIDTRVISCKKCDQSLRAFTGFWSNSINNPRKIETALLFTRHTGIDRSTGTVAPNIFFTNQVIADMQKLHINKGPGYFTQYFNGCTYLSENQLTLLQDLSSDSLFIGRNRSRGMGEIELSVEETGNTTFDMPQWNASFREKYKKTTESEPSEGIYFTVGLESHAILLDRFLRPAYDVNLNFPDITLVLKVIKTQIIKGWNSAWKMAKADDIATSMGSVFLFRYTGNDLQGVNEYLTGLKRDGIGLRTCEGFGQVSICNRIHTLTEAL
ncbi:MAG: hypothetical protein NUV86_02420 [Candidatus Scalindua sp.]|nr:hypothetical protein [Candidatus Scalindua sp.]